VLFFVGGGFFVCVFGVNLRINENHPRSRFSFALRVKEPRLISPEGPLLSWKPSRWSPKPVARNKSTCGSFPPPLSLLA